MTATTTEQQVNGAATDDKTKAAPLATVPQTTDGGGALGVFSSGANYQAGLRMANALSQSSLVPASYQGQGNIPNILIAMELASRIGASVFMVMQNLDIIHGRPGWRAQFLIATANASGRFSPLRFRWEGQAGTDSWGCRAVAKERETGEECIGSLITIGLAKSEGWASKSGSKWKTMPEQMCMYRAAAFWTRVYAPEISLGMHTAEELSDIGAAASSPLPANITPADPRALEAQIVEAKAQTAPVPPPSSPSTDDESGSDDA